MKKLVSIILAAVMTAALGICLVACSSSVDGRYYFSSVTYTEGGTETTYKVGDNIEGFTEPIDETFIIINLKEGNVDYYMRFSDYRGSTAYKGTYEKSGNTVKMNLKPTDEGKKYDLEEMTVEATIDGDTLTFTDDDGGKYVFVKGEK